MKDLIQQITADNITHGKWLNTLSFMENAGARKISACEDRVNTNIIILKHAAEEHRHAYYLKKQIAKVCSGLQTYAMNELLAPVATMQYLNKLDMEACRYIKKKYTLEGKELKFAAYLFVTYAIEVRADELYPVYQEVLTERGSRVNVKAIILEEEGHLEEMIKQLEGFDLNWRASADEVCKMEKQLHAQWTAELEKAVAKT